MLGNPWKTLGTRVKIWCYHQILELSHNYVNFEWGTCWKRMFLSTMTVFHGETDVLTNNYYPNVGVLA